MEAGQLKNKKSGVSRAYIVERRGYLLPLPAWVVHAGIHTTRDCEPWCPSTTAAPCYTAIRAESAAVLRDLHTQAAHAARLAASVGTCPGMLVLPDVPINAPRARLEVVWHSCRHRD